MRVRVELDQAGVALAKRLQNGAPSFAANFERRLTDVGERGTQYARTTFLTGGTTDTRTAVRSGTRTREYTHRITPSGARGLSVFDWGPIKSSRGGAVRTHLRVHEGFDAQGNQVSQFVIRPKTKPFLVFPLRFGGLSLGGVFGVGAAGGLSKKNIVGWRRKKQVILKPRPTFPTMQPWFEREIPAAFDTAMQQTVEGR